MLLIVVVPLFVDQRPTVLAPLSLMEPPLPKLKPPAPTKFKKRPAALAVIAPLSVSEVVLSARRVAPAMLPEPAIVIGPVMMLAPLVLRMMPSLVPSVPAPAMVKPLFPRVIPPDNCNWPPVAPEAKVAVTAPVPKALVAAVARMTPKLFPEAAASPIAPL